MALVEIDIIGPQPLQRRVELLFHLRAGKPAVAPSEATVADNSYPLSRKLFFYYPKNAPPRVSEFVLWSLTTDAQAMVTKVGYFPLPTAGK